MPELDFSQLPNRGWILDDVVDLGDLAGACQRCDTEIRYEHHCHHPMGIDAIVGCICCGDITQDYERAKRLENSLKRLSLARARFLISPRWKTTLKGNLTMEYRGYRFTVFGSGTGFKAFAGEVCSRRIYESVYAAKLSAEPTALVAGHVQRPPRRRPGSSVGFLKQSTGPRESKA